MTTQNYNRVQIFFNAEHEPYLYGAVHIVRGSLENQWAEKPFVVSKRKSNGEVIYYGTVRRTLEKIVFQLDRLKAFQVETQAKLDAAGITVIQGDPSLPRSEFTDRIIDEQEALVEDVLLTVSVYIRILSEIFPQKLKNSEVNVYDYEGGCVGRIKLSEIADLLVHNRYIIIKDHYVVDLISDEKFMTNTPQIGLKIDFAEYLSEVENIVYGITVKELVTKLWGMTKQMSACSNIKDIVFLTQNLYTLGGSVVGTDVKTDSGPLQTILNRVVHQYLKRIFPKDSTPPDGTEVTVPLYFSTPKFSLEPDLNQKLIRITTQVNGNPETLTMDYESFFSEVIKGFGNRKLHAIVVE